MEGIMFDIVNHEHLPEVLTMLHQLCDKYQLDNGTYGIYSLPDSQVIGTTTLPLSWIQIYMEYKFFKHDPAIHIPMLANRPLDWKILEEFDTLGFFPLYFQNGHGNHGISIPIQGTGADVSLFTFSKNCKDEEEWEHHKEIIMEHLLADATKMRATCAELFDVQDRFGIDELDERQLEILQRMAAGNSTKDVAKVMEISPRTVEAQVGLARKKLRAETTHQLMCRATALRLIYPR